VEDIRRKLSAEGFEQVDAHVSGSVAKQLREALAARHSNGAGLAR